MSDPPSPFYPADNPAALAHIALLQGVITRLAGNSASCKTWCITLVGAILSLAAAAHSPMVTRIVIIPLVIFGFLDAMYLGQESAYRDLYNQVVTRIRRGDYCRDEVFEAGTKLKLRGFIYAVGSWSIWPLYLSLIALYVAGLLTGTLAQLAVVIK